MTQSVVQIGNSAGIIIPADMRKKLGIKKGSKLSVETTPDGKGIVITKPGNKSSKATTSPDLHKWMKKFNRQYGPAMAELAKK